MEVQAKKEVWAKLFDDKALGAGNFLIKAHQAYPDRNEVFLFLEKPYVSPSGHAHSSFSLDTLYTVVAELAAWYAHHDVQQGAYVCVYLGDGIASFLHFLALNSLGAVPVLVNGNLRVDIAVAYAQINRFTVFAYDRETAARWQLPAPLAGVKALDAGFAEGAAAAMAPLPAGQWPVERHGDDTIMICHSSGTTGIPKAVLFGHDQFFAGKRERLQGFVERDDDRLATAMPTTHAAGISYLMTGTLLQLPTLSLNTQLGGAVAEAIVGFRATIVTAFSQTYASLAEQNLPDAFLGTVQRFYNTGDTAHESHIRELLRIAPQARFTDMFGASELGMSQFYKVSRANDVTTIRTVGSPAPYAHCVILSPDGRELADGVPGYFGVRSPTVTPGYHGQPHLTALTRLNGYWLTGDVGLRKSNGEFVHLDRIVDVVDTTLGTPGYTLLLEEHLLRLDEVFDVSVTGVSRGPVREEAVLVLVRLAAGATLDVEQLLHHTLSCHPFQGKPALPDYTLCVGVIAPDFALPVGSTGKVLKRVVRDGFWSWQRDFDGGDRSRFAELLWNHQADLSALPREAERSLLEHVFAA
ncbi:class I adenylate-forming enzyme family protein [Burkholderia plantarii]|uniref:class I adenylate-forming enzyme family protein n=1 Tax=Burkholderia plantarii TaxID=41899 RepID=UPI0018DE48CE|nr:class I adenylate-forming enzyme family protein [Burkholderia plantarii]MBI0329629.1 acyl--CoA ligase [Burkholderia plantarii]